MHYCNDFGFVIITFLRNFGVRIMVVVVLDCMELQVLKCWHSFIWEDEYYFVIYVCHSMHL